MANPLIAAELERIAKNNGGLLTAEAVVEAASEETSPLHSWFNWDDTEAAHQYRLWQARRLFRVTVINIGGKATSFAVNLSSDRQAPGGGYRITTAVLGNAEHRKQMLADALEELQRIQEKYASLKELAKVFDAIKDVRKRVKKAA